MEDYKAGGEKGNSNLFATNRLFKKSPLFRKRKKKAPGVYDPKAKYRFDKGGVTRTKLSDKEEQAFQKFYNTLPDNLMQDDPEYDIRGYWDSEGRPEEFNYNQPKEDDGYYHAYSINSNTGEYLKAPTHPTFQHAVDEDRKIGFRPVTNVQGRNIAIENESIIEPEAQSFLRNMTGPVSYNAGGALLTKKVTCKKCGWTWDAADGGSDMTKCHKCGGQGLIHAQIGGGFNKFVGGGEPCEQGFDRDPITGECVSIMGQTERVQRIEEVPTNQYSQYIAAYEEAHPRDEFVYKKKADYLKRNKNWNRQAGLSQDNFNTDVEGNFNRNWEYDRNSEVIEQFAKDHGINPKNHVEIVEKMADKGNVSRDMIAHSKYGSKLQPTMWARSLAGAQELANFLVKASTSYIPGVLDKEAPDVFNKEIKGLTKKENKEIHESRLGALESLAWMDHPGLIIGNALSGASLASGSGYGDKDKPGFFSGEFTSDMDPLKAALLNPALYAGLAEGLVSAPKIAASASNLYKGAKGIGKFLDTESGLLSNASKINPWAGTFEGESLLPKGLQFNKLDDPEAFYRLTKDPKNYGLGVDSYFNKGVPLTGDLANTFPKGSRAWGHRYSGPKYNQQTGKIDEYFGKDHLFKVKDESLMKPFLNFPEEHLTFYQQAKEINPGSSQHFQKDWLKGWTKGNTKSVPETIMGSNYVSGFNKIKPGINKFGQNKILLDKDLVETAGQLPEQLVQRTIKDFTKPIKTKKNFNNTGIIIGEDNANIIKTTDALRKEFKGDLYRLNKLKAENPGINLEHPSLTGYHFTKNQIKKIPDFLKGVEQNKKSIASFANYFEKQYADKMALINKGDDVFQNIAKESPQYIDEIAAHLKNPSKSNEDFLNDLVIQSNTYARFQKNSKISDGIRGRSIGRKGYTMDVEGIAPSDYYGAQGFKIQPTGDRVWDILNTPLAEKWSKRIPEFKSDIVLHSDGMHHGFNPKYRNFLDKRLDRLDANMGQTESVRNTGWSDFQSWGGADNNINFQTESLIPDYITNSKYFREPRHLVFESPTYNAPLENFQSIPMGELERLGKLKGIGDLDYSRFFKGTGKGFKYGGLHKFVDGGPTDCGEGYKWNEELQECVEDTSKYNEKSYAKHLAEKKIYEDALKEIEVGTTEYAILEEAYNAKVKKLEKEKARVLKVRGNVIPASKALDEADDLIKFSNPFYQDYMYAKNPKELALARKALPQEIKNVLPNQGLYNVAKWDSKTNKWDEGLNPGRELYCTPYGCFAYQKAGASDVPTIGGNIDFANRAATGNFAFEKINPNERQPGDMALMVEMAPNDYSDPNSGESRRPHHTTIYAEPDPKFPKDTKKGNFYNANSGSRLNFEKTEFDMNGEPGDRFDYYRYVGAQNKINNEVLDLAKQKEEFNIKQEQRKNNAALPSIPTLKPNLITQNNTATLQYPKKEEKLKTKRKLFKNKSFKYGGLNKHEEEGMILDLSPEEIKQYTEGGYVIEDISVPSLSHMDNGGEPCPQGFQEDPVTGDCVVITERTQDIQEVPINQYSKYITEYEEANPRDAYVYQKKAEYLNKHKGLNRMAGLSQDNFPEKVESNYNKNWEYDKNSAVIEKFAKEHGINPNNHAELVEKLADKGAVSYDMIANSKYGSKLQPSLWARSLAGAQELGNFVVKQLPGEQGDVFNYQTPGLTKKEWEDIHDSNFGALQTFSAIDIPGAVIGNSIADLSTASGGNYQESPGLLSGELKSNMDPLKATLLNPFNYSALAKGLFGVQQGIQKLGRILAKEKSLPGSPNAVDFSKYLTQEEAVAARGQRLISQKNKPGWNEQLTPELEQRLSTAVERHNPDSDILGERLGVNLPGRTGTEVSKNANLKGVPLNEANKARVAGHETGHYYSNSPEEGAEWASHFDFSKLIHKTRTYLRGKGRLDNYANEIRERAAQLKDYIAQKNGIPLNQDFKITQVQLDDAIKNYVKDTGLDNTMSKMLGALKNKKGFLKTMNKYALGTAPYVVPAAIIGSSQIPQNKYGGLNKFIESGVIENNMSKLEIKKLIAQGYVIEEI